jgi:murein tripeptide amidase MpaA
MHINSQFDSGNIQVIAANDPNNIQLAIANDNQSEFFQWFHFKLQTTAFQSHTIHLMNASQSAYVEGWHDYQAVASYDRQYWFRVPTKFDGAKLTIEFMPEHASVYLAYFTPYSFERHQDLLHDAQLSDECEIEVLGQTLDGRDISVLRCGDPTTAKQVVWITARQHPGETMAEWFMEGLIGRLLDEDEAISRSMLSNSVFYLVPNMNPDGSIRGHLRTNAIGVNLNREWQAPSVERSPEVYYVREKMLETGVDLYLDIHGDEALPYNFVAGNEGIPRYNDRLAQLEQQFSANLVALTPEFQTEYGYPKDKPGEANLTVASCWVGQQFDCLALTLEMPFKDNCLLPDPITGWSANRSALLGQDVLTVIYQILPQLR